MLPAKYVVQIVCPRGSDIHPGGCSFLLFSAVARKTWQWVGVRNEAEARACVLSRLRRRVGLVVVREMARHRLRRVPYIGVPRHIVEERMQPFHLRAIERGGGAAVSAADFYAFQQRQGACRGAATPRERRAAARRHRLGSDPARSDAT